MLENHMILDWCWDEIEYGIPSKHRLKQLKQVYEEEEREERENDEEN